MPLPDKRRSRRIRIGQPFRLQMSDANGANVEETNITKNVSREGIFFVTERSIYAEGTRLRVTVPYHEPRDPKDRQYLGQVVRVEALPEGQYGVAIQFLTEIRAH